MAQTNRKPGRPFSTGETVTEPVKVVFTQSEYDLLEELRRDVPKATFIKQLIRKAKDAIENTQLLQPLRYISTVPGGDWREALDQSSSFVISSDLKGFLQASSTDWLFLVSGDSMRGAGIMDGQLAVVKPLSPQARPRIGEPAIVQIVLQDGEIYESTVKKWGPMRSNGIPELRDGDDNVFEYPENVERVIPIGTVYAVIGRI